MKNLFFTMMAILLINVSYAGEEVGESLKGDCVAGIQSSRFQENVDGATATVKDEESKSEASAQ